MHTTPVLNFQWHHRRRRLNNTPSFSATHWKFKTEAVYLKK